MQISPLPPLLPPQRKAHTSKEREVAPVSRVMAEAAVREAVLARARGDIPLAIGTLHPVAHAGHAQAQFLLGEILLQVQRVCESVFPI
jgi:hypothetical protein